jgi:hypothetical protein
LGAAAAERCVHKPLLGTNSPALPFLSLPNTVWIVSNEQLLDWVQHPVPVSQLDSVTSLHCSTPQVDAKICNGMPANEDGLLSHCTFDDFPFYTCVSCPLCFHLGLVFVDEGWR